MKTLNPVTILVAALFFIFCFVNPSLAFNPQPEPPAEGAHQIDPADKAMKVSGDNEAQTSPGNIPLREKAMEPLDHPPEPGQPQLMQQTMPGPGSDKMQQDPEEEPIQALGTKMIDPGDDGKPAMVENPKMIDPGDDKPVIKGSPKMVHPPEGPLQPTMKKQQMKR